MRSAERGAVDSGGCARAIARRLAWTTLGPFLFGTALAAPPPTPEPPHPRLRPADSGAALVQDVVVEAPDFRALAAQVCGNLATLATAKTTKDELRTKIEAAKEPLCRLAKGPDLPPAGVPTAYIENYARALCAQDLEGVSALDPEGVGMLERACGREGLKASGTTGLSGVGLNLVEGFAEFLKNRARRELLVYATERFGQELCRNAPTDGSAAADDDLCEGGTPSPPAPGQRLHVASVFPKTCRTVFPDGAGSDLDLDSLTSGRASVSLREDMQRMPVRVAQHADLKLTPEARKAWLLILDAASTEARAVPKGSSPLGYFKAVAEKLDQQRDSKCLPALGCDLKKTDGDNLLPCAALLPIEIGRAGADLFEKSTSVNLSQWLDVSIKAYCRNYSPSNPDCVIDHDYPTKWHADLREFVDTFHRLAEVQAAIDAARKGGSFPSEIAKRSMSDVGAALDAALQVVADILERKKPQGAGPGPGSLRSTGAVMKALLSEDLPGLQQSLFELASWSPSDSAAHRTLALAAALASARDAKSVDAAIADAAAPLRSYRTKYDPGSGRSWTFNAYAGYMAAAQRNGDVADQPAAHDSETASSLTAPVGFDVTLWRSRKRRHHLGMTFTIVDPFALTTHTSESGDVKATWSSILAPGVFGRWGIGRSPVSLLAGVVRRPGLQAAEECGGEPCWRGATQFGVGLAVDIPLLLLREGHERARRADPSGAGNGK